MSKLSILIVFLLPLTSVRGNIGENRVQIVQRLGRTVQSEGSESLYEKGGYRIIVLFSAAGLSVSENIFKMIPPGAPDTATSEISKPEFDALLQAYGADQTWQPEQGRRFSWMRADGKLIARQYGIQADTGLVYKVFPWKYTPSVNFLDSVYAKSRETAVAQKHDDASKVQHVFGGQPQTAHKPTPAPVTEWKSSLDAPEHHGY